ncbi:hypothetical protein [Sphingobacterium sp.]|uniref:hypothetical protein n=1 Tax=Sphingobacterium sp. TaxID=341027 RepID=UPI002897FB89|nr:hypothetical protein [Sphingobacterium sp.]
MNLEEVKSYIRNWNQYLREKGIKGLVKKLEKFQYFEFNADKLLGGKSTYVHAYLGISEDLENVKLFIITDTFDSKKTLPYIEKHICVADPVKFEISEQLQAEISDKKALKRIKRWQKSPKSYLKGSFSEKNNVVRCFTIPTDDLRTQLNRAYFAIKKAKDKAPLDYEIDLIIRNIDTKEMKESNISYDTIRLVPPFPPTTENFYLIDEILND